MAPLLPRLVGKEQNAFIAGRTISDNIALIQEIVHSMSSYKPRVLFFSKLISKNLLIRLIGILLSLFYPLCSFRNVGFPGFRLAFLALFFHV